MSLARIHDKHNTKKFWEQKIERHSEMAGNEELRLKKSALSKLREEWVTRLELRSLGQRSVNEDGPTSAAHLQPLRSQPTLASLRSIGDYCANSLNSS